jgi:hypothetical protein
MSEPKKRRNIYGLPGTIYVKNNESRLDIARRLVIEEIDDLVDSTSPAMLNRLRRIADELEEVECRL